MTGLDAAHVRERLERYLSTTTNTPCRVEHFGVMADGHAGLTFGFDLRGGCDGAYILKIGPPGVPRRGSTDVFRQAPLLRALAAEGLPVPDVPWAESSEDVLGAPFIVMQRLPGRTFIVWEPHDSFAHVSRETIRSLWLQDIRVLARLHRVDWQARLADWEAPFTLRGEIDRWGSILRHALDPSWLDAGQRLGRTLIEQVPDGEPVGLVHGDYQPGNALYDGGKLTGIIDWDLAGIGAQGCDVGWLMMTVDPAAWAEGWRPVAPVLRDELVGAYRDADGPALRDLAWYQAFSQFKLGAIACLNVKLHRDGRRHDPIWERFAPSVSTLFARGEALLRQRSTA